MLHWIRAATQSGIGPLVRFAYGLKKDFKAVISAVETSWSNGQTEGQINHSRRSSDKCMDALASIYCGHACCPTTQWHPDLHRKCGRPALSLMPTTVAQSIANIHGILMEYYKREGDCTMKETGVLIPGSAAVLSRNDFVQTSEENKRSCNAVTPF